MIQPDLFLRHLVSREISFFTGVPDSLLKGLISTLSTDKNINHVIAVNEGAAIGLATGFHLATGKSATVYLQNSGLGNTVNPLTSLADKEMYGIPMLLIIGWRGQPGIADEPQHAVMGKITPALLAALDIPFIVLKKNDTQGWQNEMDGLLALSKKQNCPVALLVEAGVFPESEAATENQYELSSEDAIAALYEELSADDVVICTTGKIGRVFYKINSDRKKISRYFLNVGSMGHAISIATGLALFRHERVIVLDGDGSLLMHFGSLALPPSLHLDQFIYVLLNNGTHQSVGAQPTMGFSVDFCALAKGCGFKQVLRVEKKSQLQDLAAGTNGQRFIEIRINTYTDPLLPRPKETPLDAKRQFMNQLLKNNSCRS